MSRVAVLLLALLLGVLASAGTVKAQATTLTVNSTNDVDDGTCDATHCSLREAINAANANSGTDTIAFNIPTSDPGFNATTTAFTIQPTAARCDDRGITG